MVMGPTHAMSGAMVWLAGSSLAIQAVNPTNSMPVLAVGTLVAAGAALAPDIDSHSSTIVSSFGAAGKATHKVVNGVSVSVYNATRTRYDTPKTNGHRTLFHTAWLAMLAGGLVSLGSSVSKTVELFGKDFAVGQLFSLAVMFLFTHLALGGLFEHKVRSTRKKYGVLGMMAVSAVITLSLAALLPANDTYPWLGLAVGVGWFMHLLGDLITKMGIPLLGGVVKIRGKRWWDFTLPAFMRIRAGGKFEKAVLLPLISTVTAFLVVLNIPGAKDAASSIIGMW